MIRNPVVSGQFYQSDPNELSQFIKNCFMHKFGPGKKFPTLESKKIYGVICPHAGYMYSGPSAAHSYYAISSQNIDLAVIIGPNHWGIGSDIATISDGQWKTPLGLIEIDSDAASHLLEITETVEDDFFSHSKDHSLEVQIPMLQTIFPNKLKILPIILGRQDVDSAREVGTAIADLAKTKKLIIIGSSDFTHYEKNVFAHEHFERGDIQLGFKNAYCIVENHYVLPRVHQSYLEPHAVVAEPDILKGSIKIYTGTQGQFIVRNEVARILSLQKNKVEIIPMNMGGGFGAKYGIYDALTAVLAIVLKQPVRLVLTRSEDFQSTTPSANSKIYLKTGALKNGYITALQAKIEIDNGIFAMPFSGIMASLIGGYYKCKNTCIDCYEINTHKPQIGAYRAPGAPQITFALESNIDEMAEKLDKDPLEFRYQNAVESGDPMGNNAPWPEGIGLKKCIKKMKQYTGKIISKKREFKLTLSRALSDDIETKSRSIASLRRAKLKTNRDLEKKQKR